MAKFEVEFTHVVEIKYKGWVEADSESEAIHTVEEEPFAINDLEDTGDEQGIEVKDVQAKGV